MNINDASPPPHKDTDDELSAFGVELRGLTDMSVCDRALRALDELSEFRDWDDAAITRARQALGRARDIYLRKRE